VAARDEEAGQHDDARQGARPERQHVELGERHVPGAQHQRDQEVAEAPHHDRHDHEEDHECGVHREDHVVDFGRDHALGLAEEPVETGHRRLRPAELPPDQHGEKATDQQHEQPHEQELPGNHLVIGGEDVRAHEAQIVVLVDVVRCRGCALSHRVPTPLRVDPA
jgi:hypothetical protein